MYFPTFPYILLDLLVPFFFPGCLTNPMALTSTYKQVTLESSLQLRLLTPPQAHMWNYQLDISAWMIHRKQRFNVPKPLLIIFLLKPALVLFCRQYISFHLSLHLWSSHNFLGLYITLNYLNPWLFQDSTILVASLPQTYSCFPLSTNASSLFLAFRPSPAFRIYLHLTFIVDIPDLCLL